MKLVFAGGMRAKERKTDVMVDLVSMSEQESGGAMVTHDRSPSLIRQEGGHFILFVPTQKLRTY
ncbi:hypothetical protein OUZ56_002952 [Daphnia magna]|uniref:Uncharacterized protein n=1 Tax=Daphnia magna TaxID=35525 RepID=A0ABR0A799_9CRUS|nr:hypothetical protein OUZ56_002952 [Daphnia magna]